MSITLSPAGDFYIKQGPSGGYGFRCDGRDYPTAANRTISCKELGTFAIETNSKKNGDGVGISRWEISADGAMLKTTATPLGAGGLSKSLHRVFTRASGSGGFSGTWNDAKPFESTPSRLELSLTSGILHYAFPEVGQYADARLDGSEAAVRGPGVPTELTMSIKELSERKLSTRKKLDGRVLMEGYLDISRDGRTLTEMFWSPDRPDKKAVLVYRRQ